MLITTRQDATYDSRVRIVPCRASGKRIAWMPTQSDNATTPMVRNEFVANAGKGHRVKILSVAHFNTAQVEAHDGRIITTGFKYIAPSWLRMLRVSDARPSDAVARIILVTKHTAVRLQLSHTGE